MSTPLTAQQERVLTAVQGYLELGMPKEALRELAGLSEEFQQAPEAIEARERSAAICLSFAALPDGLHPSGVLSARGWPH